MSKIVVLSRNGKAARVRLVDNAEIAFASPANSSTSSLHTASTDDRPAQDSRWQTLQVRINELDRLYFALDRVAAVANPRTFKLLRSSRRKIAQKVIEEAGEVALEAIRDRSRDVISESADLLYHLVVLWHRAGVDPEEIWSEMRRRACSLGIAEKPPKAGRRKLAKQFTNCRPTNDRA